MIIIALKLLSLTIFDIFVVVQSLNHIQLFATSMDCSIQPSHPLSSLSAPALHLSQHRGLFQWVDSSHQVAKILEFQLQHRSSNEYSGLISFRMDWLDLLTVQGTLKSLLQHHSSKASLRKYKLKPQWDIPTHPLPWLQLKRQFQICRATEPLSYSSSVKVKW